MQFFSKKKYCFIIDKHGTEIAKIEMIKNNFYLKFDLVEDHYFTAKIDENAIWDKRFGHINLRLLKFVQDVLMINHGSWYLKTGGVKLNDYVNSDLDQETDVQIDDIMIKALPKSRLEFLKLKLGMPMTNIK